MSLALALSKTQAPQTQYAAEAERLTQKTCTTFFDLKDNIWKPLAESAEGIGLQGYTFWSSLLAWQAVIEAAKVDPKTWKPRIGFYFEALEKYYDAKEHAYCAWKYFPGNDDKFYDDNAWASIACSEAFELTGQAQYRARATDILDMFVKPAWDNSGNPGGLRWGTRPGIANRADRTVSATAASALAALLVAKTQNRTANREWARHALDWIRTKLSAPNGLIYDGFLSPTFSRMPTLWTYNTGVPIRAAVEYFRQTHDTAFKDWAIKMGDASIDRSNSPLYDGSVANEANRYWYDSTFFVHYLADGLRDLSLETGNPKYIQEARREADFCMHYLRDADGLYWRNMRLWTIDTTRQESFQKLTGQTTPGLAADSSERSLAPTESRNAVNQRPMVKTLLANAGTARFLWLVAH